MIHILPELGYPMDALYPNISNETLEYHHGKHHKAYVDNLNKLIAWTEFENSTLEEIVKKAPKWPLFNNAAQVWNHNFYFESFSESPRTIPEGKLLDMIDEKWGSFEMFKQEFNKMAMANFWSGWTWLTRDWTDWPLNIWNTQNASTPLTSREEEWILIPLLTCDIWEHAYYIDYRNRRADYLEKFWNVVDWNIVERRI
ncbi:MAG: hypothetical protein ACD_3C00084G0006 [uncultured bacterium (gcode 4)]|uniref:Superoxide dismutase n=1 Tax=uncultured bacterium (gcode 4) TaxID=1234023 RepID=K2GXS8_9BACT|nr:MAG: hypothetical protein ACD_3C00084G0006 [uncultured bacterium (gcode 4)]